MSHSHPHHTLWPSHIIHIPAFFSALILAPLLVTALSFYVVIPVFALLFGAPFYLAIGTPLLLWLLSRRPCSAGDCATAAIIANVVFCTLTMLYAALTKNEDILGFVAFYLLFGSIFAPLWAGTFGWLYLKFTRNA